MINRKILFGYQIRNGDMVPRDDEAMVVTRVFTLYATGLSYQKITDMLNGEGIPFSGDAPMWNKHKVKRLLENPRYTGRDGYPALVERDVFQEVQAQIQSKTSGYSSKEKSPTADLKKLLFCQTCNGRLLGLGGKKPDGDNLRLKCESCGAMITIPNAELIEEISRQTAEHETPAEVPYQPSEEVVRLTNAINRGLENPEAPEDIVSLILRGAAARYDCCPAVIQHENNDRQPAVDHARIRQAVARITISTENTVTVAVQ